MSKLGRWARFRIPELAIGVGTLSSAYTALAVWCRYGAWAGGVYIGGLFCVLLIAMNQVWLTRRVMVLEGKGVRIRILGLAPDESETDWKLKQ